MNDGFVWPVRVYYEDTDAGGVVYYANYLKFMERARTEWLRSIGVEQDDLTLEAGVVFVVVDLSMRYRKPARFNDRLLVTVSDVQTTRTTFIFQQRIYRDGSPAELLTESQVRAACVDATDFRPKQIPEVILGELC